MKKIKIILVLLLLQILIFAGCAYATHQSGYCNLNNNWHWYDSQNDASSPEYINCPNNGVDPPLSIAPASAESNIEHHALQVLAITIPLTSAGAILIVYRHKK